jgi:hypothetical protein
MYNYLRWVCGFWIKLVRLAWGWADCGNDGGSGRASHGGGGLPGAMPGSAGAGDPRSDAAALQRDQGEHGRDAGALVPAAGAAPRGAAPCGVQRRRGAPAQHLPPGPVPRGPAQGARTAARHRERDRGHGRLLRQEIHPHPNTRALLAPLVRGRHQQRQRLLPRRLQRRRHHHGRGRRPLPHAQAHLLLRQQRQRHRRRHPERPTHGPRRRQTRRPQSHLQKIRQRRRRLRRRVRGRPRRRGRGAHRQGHRHLVPQVDPRRRPLPSRRHPDLLLPHRPGRLQARRLRARARPPRLQLAGPLRRGLHLRGHRRVVPHGGRELQRQRGESVGAVRVVQGGPRVGGRGDAHGNDPSLPPGRERRPQGGEAVAGRRGAVGVFSGGEPAAEGARRGPARGRAAAVARRREPGRQHGRGGGVQGGAGAERRAARPGARRRPRRQRRPVPGAEGRAGRDLDDQPVHQGQQRRAHGRGHHRDQRPQGRDDVHRERERQAHQGSADPSEHALDRCPDVE